MPSLRELQEGFLAAALYGDHDSLTGCIHDDGIPARARLAIYANNARENFIGTLESAFPVVRALGGHEWFYQCAQQYWREQPSRAGNLHYVGTHFSTYLQSQLASTDHAYFADVARLEWAYQECMVAADHPGFEVAALASVPPAQHTELRFTLHPAARLVGSMYPVLDIWSAHQADGNPVERIDLAAGAQWLVVIRRTDHVQFRAVDRASFVLLHSLAEGTPLGTAAENALDVAPDFDLAAALAQFISLGVLVDFLPLTLAH